MFGGGIFWTPYRSLSFGWPMMGVKSSMVDSYLAAISDDEFIVVWGVDFNGRLTMYVKDRH